jgi:hypothetical protein
MQRRITQPFRRFAAIIQRGHPVCTENLIRIDWGGNHLTSAHNDRAAMFCLGHLGLTI